MRQLYNEFGFTIDEVSTEVKDQIRSSNIENNEVLTKNIINSSVITKEKEIIYKGVALKSSSYETF